MNKLRLAALGGFFLATALVAVGSKMHLDTGRGRALTLGRDAENGYIWRAKTDRKLVALTFDDGPDPRFTPTILDTLSEKRVKATFFVTGEGVSKHPDILKREVAEGHQIGNHTWSHPNLTKIPRAQVDLEITRCDDEISRITGARTRFMRPPYGETNGEITNMIKGRGYQVVIWSISLQELRYPDPEEDATYVAKHVQPGDIILGHDGRQWYRERGVQMLPRLIDKLRAKGYSFVTVEELVAEAKTTDG